MCSVTPTLISKVSCCVLMHHFSSRNEAKKGEEAGSLKGEVGNKFLSVGFHRLKSLKDFYPSTV